MKFLKKHLIILSIVLTTCFLLQDTLDIFASDWTNVYSGDYSSYYNSSSIIDGLISNDIIAYAISNNAIHYTDNNNTPSISIGYISSNDFMTNFYNSHGFQLLSNCPYFSNGNSYGNYDGEYDLNGWNTIIFQSDSNSVNHVNVVRIKNNGNVALVDGNYIVSDSPLEIYISQAYYNDSTQLWQQNDLWQGYATLPRIVNNDSTNSNFNGNYTFRVPNDMYSYNVVPNIVFTDLDMFYANDDYYPFTYSDFTFDNRLDYFNYNYIKMDGQITNPNDPVVTPLNETAISNLMFRDNTFYSGTGVTNFYHTNRLTFNEYQLKHPEYFNINFDYYAYYKDDTMSTERVFRFIAPGSSDLEYGYSMSLDEFLVNIRRYGSPVSLQLSSDSFYTGSSLGENTSTLSYYINLTINRVTGTNTQYANPDSILENVISAVDNIGTNVSNFMFGGNYLTNLGSIVPVYESYITDFYIRGYVTITYKDDPLYVSGTYSDYYDFLTGDNKVITNESGNNNYPSNQESNLPVPSNGSDNNSINTGGGSIANAYGGNVTFNGIVQRVFEPFTLDTVTVAGVK